MHIRCPHCQNAVEVVGNEEFASVSCPSCGSVFDLVPETASYTPETRTIAHFELLEQLGAGGFGTVWKARDTKLDRLVAVKIPRRDQVSGADAEMFFREARAAAQLRHPHIVAVHEVGRENGTLYIVSDFVQGVTLADRLTAGPFTPREAAALLATVADALHHAHEGGVIHRDLKPQNIMLDGHGQPKLMDFGLAKREAGEVTMTIDGKILGTPAYMSPEQARGEGHHVDRRTDIYSLGVMLFELLTGERPFRGNQRMLLHQVIHEEPPSPKKLNGRISRDLETICLKCMEKEPSKRYATAIAVAEELRRFLSLKPILARPVSAVERAWRWGRRHSVISLLGAVAALAAAVVLVGGLFMIVGGGFALNAFESMWVSQVVDDNQAVASAIAEATKARFNDQLESVESEAEHWRELFVNRSEDSAAFGERIAAEIQKTFYRHNNLDGWHVTDRNGRMLSNFGDVPRRGTGMAAFDNGVVNKQFGWQGWFNGKIDHTAERERKTFSDEMAFEALKKRERVLYVSAPYKRRQKDFWVMTISRKLTSDGQPVGVLAGEFRFDGFVDFIRQFESAQGYQQRKVVIANEQGEALYHPELTDSISDFREEDGPPIVAEDENVPVVGADHPLVRDSFKNGSTSDLASYADPWYTNPANPGRKYFVGRAAVELRNQHAKSGQKLAVLVFHDKDNALQGFKRAKWTTLLLGCSVLLVAGVLFIGVLVGLRSATRLDGIASAS